MDTVACTSQSFPLSNKFVKISIPHGQQGVAHGNLITEPIVIAQASIFQKVRKPSSPYSSYYCVNMICTSSKKSIQK